MAALCLRWRPSMPASGDRPPNWAICRLDRLRLPAGAEATHAAIAVKKDHPAMRPLTASPARSTAGLSRDLLEINSRSAAHGRWRARSRLREKTAKRSHAEAPREVNYAVEPYLHRAQANWRYGPGGGGDGFRTILHQAGATALSHLLQFSGRPPEQRNPCL
jgi:hypothetical protein